MIVTDISRLKSVVTLSQMVLKGISSSKFGNLGNVAMSISDYSSHTEHAKGPTNTAMHVVSWKTKKFLPLIKLLYTFQRLFRET